MSLAPRPFLSLCAADIMSKSMVIVPREMSLQGAARLLGRASVSGAPVVDDAGRCIGVISTTDFMHWVEHDQTPGTAGFKNTMSNPWQMSESIDACSHVKDCMTGNPVLVKPTTRIGELARLMMEAHIHRVIVVEGASQRPVGIVSSTDILAAVSRADAQEPHDTTPGAARAADTIY
ncbi:MAG TPA: CBS domain-containing protein [Gemmataceae bacterium]|nr:CBS domain-containing protein [Gemmataceae bacterium]